MEQKILAAGYASVQQYNDRINKAYNDPARASVEKNASAKKVSAKDTYSVEEAAVKSGEKVKVHIAHIFEGTDISYVEDFEIDRNDVITINGAYYRRNTDTDYLAENVAYRNYEKCQGWTYFGGHFWRSGYIGRALTNYLGTIANLSSPIVKNASQTLKITYTLTNAE
jgi:hypothetical protein